MKNLNFKMLLLFALAAPFAGKAQQMEHLNANLVKAGIGIGGNLFSAIVDSNVNNATWGAFEVPVGSGATSVFTAAVWLTATDANNNVHCASQRYKADEPGFTDGPVAGTYNTAYNQFYNRVFKVTRQEVNTHLANSFPMQLAQVSMPVKMWPGKGNPFVAAQFGVTIADRLAPFVDTNNDGIYNPEQGDFPLICGDEGIFFVFNSQRNGVDSFDFEIRGLAEAFAGSGLQNDAITNTVFVSYEVENKSGKNYNDFRFSLYEDIDLGCFANDRIGCDPGMNLMFGYNGTIADPSCNGSTGYMPYKVAHGAKFLNASLSSFGYFTNGAASSMSDPGTCQQYRNYATGFWSDGTPFSFGGVGYNTGGATSFIFPGNPSDTMQWSEMKPSVAAVLPAGDRRVVGSVSAPTFNAGETRHFDMAFTTSYDSLSTPLGIIDTLKRDELIVQNFYYNSILACRANNRVSGINEAGNNFGFEFSPNPAQNEISIQSQLAIDELQLLDMQGRVVLNRKAPGTNNVLDVSAVAPGVYLLQLKAGGKSTSKKLVIE